MNTDGVRDPFAHGVQVRPPDYWQAIPGELHRALDGTPALHPDSVGVLWDLIQLRYMDPLGRLAPTYPEAIMELAHGIALRWSPSARDIQRLEQWRPGDPAGARWLLVLMVLHGSEPPLLGAETPDRKPIAQRRYGSLWLESGGGSARTVAYDRIRIISASTIRECRRILRGPHEAEAWSVIGAMERSARGLGKPLEERLYGQWVRAEKKGGMELETHELILALRMISPPSPQEATRLFTEVTDALTGALARRWKMRFAKKERTDSETPEPKPKPEPEKKRDALEQFNALVYAETGGQGMPEERQDARRRLKRDLVRVGLLAALRERAVPVKIRRSRTYLAEGQKLLPADDIEFTEFLRWLKARALYLAEEELRGADPLRGTGREDKLPPEKAPPVQEQDPRVDALYAAARDATDRALLDRLYEGYTRDAAAEQEGLSREAGKKRFQRLRKRAEQL